MLTILHRPSGLAPAPAVTWAQERAERAATVAKTLPDISRRFAAKLRRPEGEEGA